MSNHQLNTLRCWLCSKDHMIAECNQFVTLSVDDISESQQIMFCLSNSHMINSCKSKVFYRVDNCKKKHHALLHSINEGNNNNSSSNDTTQNYQTNQHTNRYELNQKRIQLKCNPPSSPWMGVCIEAMVKFTKRLKEIVQIIYLHWVGGVLTIIRSISRILFLPKVTRNETRSSASFRTLF